MLGADFYFISFEEHAYFCCVTLLFRWGLFQVTQLTGFSDPVYAEAYVHVNQYDIVLDVLVVNQTSDTLQNCTLELATLGELVVGLTSTAPSDLLTAVYMNDYESLFFVLFCFF